MRIDSGVQSYLTLGLDSSREGAAGAARQGGGRSDAGSSEVDAQGLSLRASIIGQKNRGVLLSAGSKASGEAVQIERDPSYSEENPVYLVTGTNAKGEKYQQKVDASKVNPEKCTFAEFAAYAVEKQGTENYEEVLSEAEALLGADSMLEQINYASRCRQEQSYWKNTGNWKEYLRQGNFMDKVGISSVNGWERGMELEHEEKTTSGTKYYIPEGLKDPLSPYFDLAENGEIHYNGVVFQCNEGTNTISLGDTSSRDDTITVPLADGGRLVVNRKNLGDLAKALSMFTPEDIQRIMEAIAKDKAAQRAKSDADSAEDVLGEMLDEVQGKEPAKTGAAKLAQEEDNVRRTASGTLSQRRFEELEKARREEQAHKEQEEAKEAWEKALDAVGKNAPQEVQNAWREAAAKVGANGAGMLSDGEGKLEHISQLMAIRATLWYRGEWDPSQEYGILGSTAESAIEAAEQAQARLEASFEGDQDIDQDIDQGADQDVNQDADALGLRNQEKSFYQAFLDRLKNSDASEASREGN